MIIKLQLPLRSRQVSRMGRGRNYRWTCDRDPHQTQTMDTPVRHGSTSSLMQNFHNIGRCWLINNVVDDKDVNTLMLSSHHLIVCCCWKFKCDRGENTVVISGRDSEYITDQPVMRSDHYLDSLPPPALLNGYSRKTNSSAIWNGEMRK